MEIQTVSIDEITPYENNPRNNEEAVEYVANSIKEFGWQQPIVVDHDGVVIVGHTRLLAAKSLGLKEVPVLYANNLTDEQVKAYRLADNKTGELAEWDFSKLDEELSDLFDIDFDMEQFGFDDFKDFDINESKSYDEPAKSLSDRFIVPPFSVLDGRQGYWKERKKTWNDRIQDHGLTRGGASLGTEHFNDYDYPMHVKDVSVLDPALAEVCCHWFTPNKQGNKIFDTFAGDTVFGYVSSYMGNEFTGIELRQEQTVFNNDRTKGMNAKYYCDDGRNVLDHIEENSQDMYFSCPPYYDLEQYSDLKNDASNQGTYEEFYAILDEAFKKAIRCLKDNRFAVIVCGDVRDKKTGEYYKFPDDIKRTFTENGMILYNEIILLDPIGSAIIRAAKYMEHRKLAKVHQNVLVFYKGDPKQIKREFYKIEEDYEGEDLGLQEMD